MDPAREQEVIRLQLRQLDPGQYGVSRRRSDLELDRALRLVLHHDGTGRHLVSMADVADLEGDEIAAPKFAVDAKVEHGELSYTSLHLQADAKCPDVLELKRRLLPNDLALVPRFAVNGAGIGFHTGLQSGLGAKTMSLRPLERLG